MKNWSSWWHQMTSHDTMWYQMTSHDITLINTAWKGGVDIIQSHLLYRTYFGLSPLSLGKLHLWFSQMCENGITAVSSVHWHSPNYLFWHQSGKTTQPQALRCVTLSSQFHARVMVLWDTTWCVQSHWRANAHSVQSPNAPLLWNMRANQNVTHVFTRKLPVLIVCDK